MPKNILLQKLLKHIKELNINVTDDEIKKLLLLSDEDIEELLKKDDFRIRFNTILLLLGNKQNKRSIDFVLTTEKIELLTDFDNDNLLIDFLSYYTGNIGKSHNKMIDIIIIQNGSKSITLLYELKNYIGDFKIYEYLLELASSKKISSDNITRLLNFFKGYNKDLLGNKDLTMSLIDLIINCSNEDIINYMQNNANDLNDKLLEALIRNQKSSNITELLLNLISNGVDNYYPKALNYYISVIEKYGEQHPEEVFRYLNYSEEDYSYIDWSDEDRIITEKELEVSRKIDEKLINIPKNNPKVSLDTRYLLLNDLINYNDFNERKARFPGKYEEPIPNMMDYFPEVCEFEESETRLIEFITLLNKNCICVDIMADLLDLVIANKLLSSKEKEELIAINADLLFEVIMINHKPQKKYPEYLALFKYILLASDDKAPMIANTINSYINVLSPSELQTILNKMIAADDVKTTRIKNYHSNGETNNIDEIIEALELYDTEKNITPNTPIVVTKPIK